MVVGDDDADMAADDLLGRPAEQDLGALVPAGDRAVARLPDDGEVGRRHDRRELRLGLVGAMALGLVMGDRQDAERSMAGIANHGGPGVQLERRAVRLMANEGDAVVVPGRELRKHFGADAWRLLRVDGLVVASDRIRRAVAHEPLGGGVPGHDRPVELGRDDRVVEHADERPQHLAVEAGELCRIHVGDPGPSGPAPRPTDRKTPRAGGHAW